MPVGFRGLRCLVALLESEVSRPQGPSGPLPHESNLNLSLEVGDCLHLLIFLGRRLSGQATATCSDPLLHGDTGLFLTPTPSATVPGPPVTCEP